MITSDNKFKDAKKDEYSAHLLESYTSVKQINNVFKWLMPFRFKTLQKIVPKGLKGTINGMINFLNGNHIAVPYESEQSIPLWKENEIPLYNGIDKPYIIPYLLKDKKAPAVLVIPGGAYLYVSQEHEGIQTAKKLNELGFHAIVLTYRVSPCRYPCMQLDMIRAIQLMRKNSEEWGIIPDQIIALGFSAGGHLAMSVNGVYDELVEMSGDLSHIDGKPNGIVSAYGMMDLKCKGFNVTCDMIFLGDNFTEEESKRLCIRNMLNKDYPPVFMFSMDHDPTVPPKTNCIEIKPMLDELNVPCEMRIYAGNRHGFGLGEGTSAEEWPYRMVDFFKEKGVID